MNRLALHTNSYHGFPLEAAVSSAVAAGFEDLEIAAVKGWTEHIMPDMSPGMLDDIVDMIRGQGLSVPVMSAHSDLGKDERLQDFCAAVQLAQRLGCHTIVTSAGEAHFGEEEVQEDRLMKGIRVALDACVRVGMNLAVETHGRYGSGEKLLDLIDRIGSPLLGIAYDTANVTRHGGVLPQDDILKCAAYVKHVHLKDKDGPFDSRAFTALGKGWIDLDAVFKALDVVGYAGAYSVEIEYFTGTPPTREQIDTDVAESWRYLKATGRVG